MPSDSAHHQGPLADASDPIDRSLQAIVDVVEQALSDGDHELAGQLIERDFVAVWFGMHPDRLREVLDELERNGAPENGWVYTMNRVLFRRTVEDFSAPETAPDETTDFLTASAMTLSRLFGLRLMGHTVEALKLAKQNETGVRLFGAFFGRSQGWDLLHLMQTGITEMLAGDFAAALASFTRARAQNAPSRYLFIARDACVKAALIESLYGDADRARALLDEADRTPRSTSWVEAEIAAAYTIAASRVRVETAEEGLRMIESVQLRDLGELWPFYAIAVQRSLLAVGNPEEMLRRLEIYQQMSLPRIPGEGYTGSAFELAEARVRLSFNDLAGARAALERADSSIIATRILVSLLELVSGRSREAQELAIALGEQTHGLRLLELWRLSVIAGSQLSLGAEAECVETLQRVLRFPGSLSAQDAQCFVPNVNTFAREHFPEWPAAAVDVGVIGSGDLTLPSAALTKRELDALRDLASGSTREQIARAQFISLNTLKGHLRSVYRKLGVNSRTAAVLEAQRRGLL